MRSVLALVVLVSVAAALVAGDTPTTINFNFKGMIPAQTCCSSSEDDDAFATLVDSLSQGSNVIVLDSKDYDAYYRSIFSASLTELEIPSFIVEAAGVDDVIKVVNYAREQGLDFGVIGGGHGNNGLAVPRRGVLLDLSRMNSINVSADTVRFGAGAECGDLDKATMPYSRATICGLCHNVGVGYFAMGGYGALSRLHGLALDSIISVDLVTWDGRLVTASETQNADLFWAVRGALPNFGVAVSFVVRTYDVSSFYGGIVQLAASSLPAAAAWIRDRADNLNLHARHLSVISGQGRVLVMTVALWGDGTDAEKADYFASLVNLTGVMGYELGGMTYFDAQAALAGVIDSWQPRMLGLSVAGSNSLGSDQFFGTYYEQFLQVPENAMVSEINLWGGAISAVEANATAFWGRDIQWDWYLSSTFHDPTTNVTALQNILSDAYTALSNVEGASSGVYINWLGNGEADAVERAYGGNLPRLRELKAIWDPQNFFNNNFNILPASA